MFPNNMFLFKYSYDEINTSVNGKQVMMTTLFSNACAWQSTLVFLTCQRTYKLPVITTLSNPADMERWEQKME